MTTKQDAPAPAHKENKVDLKKIVDRFLSSRLPQSFSPDCHISFDRDNASATPHSWPTGTNLFTFSEALAMFEHALEMEEPGVMGGGWVRDCPAPAAPAPDAEWPPNSAGTGGQPAPDAEAIMALADEYADARIVLAETHNRLNELEIPRGTALKELREAASALRAAVEQIVRKVTELARGYEQQVNLAGRWAERAERAEQEAAALRELLKEAREWVNESPYHDSEETCHICERLARIDAALTPPRAA